MGFKKLNIFVSDFNRNEFAFISVGFVFSERLFTFNPILMKKLLPSLLTAKLLLSFLILIIGNNSFGQPKHRHWLSFLKQSACNANPIISCPEEFKACPKALLHPMNTGYAKALPGGPNCAAPIITYKDDTISVGACDGAIELNRVWKATDPQNPLLQATCTQHILLSDLIYPLLLNCPGNQTIHAGKNCLANASWVAPSVTDNCGKLYLTVSHISGNAFPVGTTTVTYTVEDLCQNSSSCSFEILVEGDCCKRHPIIQCPGIFRGCPGESLLPANTGQAIAKPGDTLCSNPSLIYEDSIISTGPCLGAIKLFRIWKAIDPFNSSNYTNCIQQIELEDVEAPSISNFPSNITLSPSPDCQRTVSWLPPIAMDKCGIQSFGSNFQPGSSFPVGTTSIQYTAVDACGNSSSKTFTITITPCCNEKPILQCPLNYTSCPGTNTSPSLTGFAIGNKSHPDCGVPIISYKDSIINYLCPGAKMIFRTWTAKDSNNSTLSSNCIQWIELKDVTPPIFTLCPGNLTVNTNIQDCKAIVQWIAPTAIDNCDSTVTIESNFKPGASFTPGVYTVIYTAKDKCGNAVEHRFTITVINNCCHSKPKIICPPDYTGCPVEHCGLNISGTATAEPGNSECPIPILSFRDSLLSVYSYCLNGKKFIRIWRATDPNDSNNYVECLQKIELIDKIPPIWNSCPADITVQSDGDCEKQVFWTPPTATDQCNGPVQITGNYSPGHKFPVGTTTIIYTAKDACGNTITHSFKLTVLGNGISIECPPNITVERTDPNLPGAYVNWNHPQITTCGICQDTLKGFIYMGTYNGSKYYCSKTTEAWKDAKKICENVGGTLCIINSAGENSFVASKLMGATAYIGLHDSNVEGLFEWVDNSSVNYTNWYPGQPNNANGDQDFVEMLPDGTWNDQYENTYREFICEVPCYTIKQIEGPVCGSLFKCGTTKVSYAAMQGNLSDTCSFYVTVQCNTGKYCESKAQNCGSMWIKNVSIANINNNSGPNNGYAYFASPCGYLMWEKSYNLCFSPGFSGNVYTVYWKVWIDYNGDGDFFDVDELVAYGLGNSTLCGIITLPGGCHCDLNNTRMRVAMSYGSYPGNPCCSIPFGEVEDYCIDIQKNLLPGDHKFTKLQSKAIQEWTDQNFSDPNTELLNAEDLNSNYDFEIHPNPAKDLLLVQLRNPDFTEIEVYNSDGKKLFYDELTSLKYSINISDWSNGIYMLILRGKNNEFASSKIIIFH